MFDKWPHKSAPYLAVCSQYGLSIVQVTLQHDGAAIVERMGQRSWRMNPIEAMIPQWQRAEKW
jgi:hypothetical protein